jgi:sporulation protein YlmC with PRC-barrel domain
MLSLSELNSKKVVTADAFVIGEVEGGNVDAKTWRLVHIHVSLNDDALQQFKLKKPFMGSVLVCIPVEFVEEVGDVITLNKNLNELKDLKECREYM